jgi:GAF domain-containing protein
MERTTDRKILGEIKTLLAVIDAGGRATLPLSDDELLKSIVEAAARLFHAAAASILLVNEAEQVLEFRVAYGASDRDLVGTKIPLNQGIAGYVVMTGQPLAISNVRQDARFNQDFAKSTGYIPTAILAMPLRAGERVIGVMEVLDKDDASSFGMQDMDLLTLFARQAALAIDQSQRMQNLQQLFILGLKGMSRENQGPDTGSFFSLLEQASQSGTDPELLALADAFHEISRLGEQETRLCLQVLRLFANYRTAQKKIRHG